MILWTKSRAIPMTSATHLPPYLTLKLSPRLLRDYPLTLLFHLLCLLMHPSICQGMLPRANRAVSNVLRKESGVAKDLCFRNLRKQSHIVRSSKPCQYATEFGACMHLQFGQWFR